MELCALNAQNCARYWRKPGSWQRDCRDPRKEGFKVFGTGGTIGNADLPDSIVRLPCDHTRDDETAAVFAKSCRGGGRPRPACQFGVGRLRRNDRERHLHMDLPFWEQPTHRWTSMMDAGVSAAFVNSSFAAKMMVPRHRALIVNLSYWASQKHTGNVIYGVAKAGTDKMTSDMAEELQPLGVARPCLYPGRVRTEAVMAAAPAGWLDLSNSEESRVRGSRNCGPC